MPEQSPVRSRLPRGDRLALGLLVLMALLAVLFPARVLECDAVIYASAGIHRDVVQSTDAGHLAWGGVEAVFARWSGALSPPLNPLYPLAWLSVAAALAGAWLVHRLLTTALGLDGVLSALLTGALLFSYSYWHFGLQGEPHALHTLSLVAFLLAARKWLSAPTARGAVLTAFALSAATLLHQTSILLVPAALLALRFACGDAAERSLGRRRQAVLFLAVYGLVVVGAYLVVGWFVRDLRTVAGYRSWIMGLSEWGGWGNWRLTSPVAALVGITRSWVGSHYLLGIEPVRALAGRLFPAASWDDELQLAGAIQPWLRPLLALLEAAVLGGTAWFLAAAVPHLRGAWRGARAFAVLLGAWLLVHTVFFMWWAPERAEFWIAFWLPLLVLMAPGLARVRVHPAAVALGLAGLILVNLGGSIAPQASSALEPATLAAVAVDPAVNAGDVILTELPLSHRAGRFVYTLEIFGLPADAARAAAVADSLRTSAAARGRALWWVGNGEAPANLLGSGLRAAAPTPVRARVCVQRLY